MPAMGFCEWIAAGRAIAKGQLTRYSEKAHFTDEFERALCRTTGARHALAVTSGTDALVASLAAAGIGPGDEVLVPAYTWMATATAPVMVGAVPILVDINETLTIDPEDIERKITPYTRAIIPVHMGNAPCDMDAIMAIAKKHGLIVIEDAAQAVGVKYKGRHLGTIGHLGAFSFNKIKNLNIGEGGALLTNDDQFFARARSYHDMGSIMRGHEDSFNEPAFIGTNMKVNEIQSAMAKVQLGKLGPALKRRQKRRAMMAEILKQGSAYRLTPHNDEANAVSLTLIAPTRDAAIALQEHTGIWNRLRDSSKHVYTNSEPVLAKRTFHPKMNPWNWARRDISYSPDMCARTLDILDRTCVVNLGLEVPSFIMRRIAERIAA